MDQITAKVSGMCELRSIQYDRVTHNPAVRVGPGPSNRGIFVKINRDGPGKGEVSVKARLNVLIMRSTK